MNPSTLPVGSNRTTTADTPADAIAYGRVALSRTVHWLGFWTAVCLPLVYLPLLYIGESTAFLALLGLQLIALFVGHGYNQP